MTVRVLLDTHIAIWAITNNPKLGDEARRMIISAETIPVVSAISIWEIAIKHALGSKRGDPMPMSGRQARDLFVRAGYEILPVTAEHAAAVDDLPLHHADPFDRMLVAQALSEPMHLLTRDARLAEYGALVTVR